MCGVIGIVGRSAMAEPLIAGLTRLEYRGYDSAGIATLEAGVIQRYRAEGKIKALAAVVEKAKPAGTIGIGHTRWATHGAPVEANAHPHATEKVAVVHNGIIENFAEIRAELAAAGCEFVTDTDTEVIPHLVTHYLAAGQAPLAAVQSAVARLDGAYALALLFAGDEETLIVARQGSPLAIGHGVGEQADEMYVGSDAVALAGLTSEVTYLDEGDIAVLTLGGKYAIYNRDGELTERKKTYSNATAMSIGKENYRHFMLKEINEQPSVIGQVLRAYSIMLSGRIRLPNVPFDPKNLRRITLVACGTSYYAGFIAKYWCEQLAGIPVDLDIASEFRYRTPILNQTPNEEHLAVFISQSGETADTLAAMRYAKAQGCYTLAVVNQSESTMAREADVVLPIYCGPEIGVASTKAFTAQLGVLACAVIAIGTARGALPDERARQLARDLAEVPASMAQVLSFDEQVAAIAHELSHVSDVLYIGRGTSYGLALEAALKFKEISYIHAEASAAGELKHGLIALIDEEMPVVAIAPYDELFEKTASNIREIAARSGKLLLISSKQGCVELADVAWKTIEMPDCPNLVSPLLYALPAQLLAYHTAVHKGTDVDQPRNLAKSVTVE